MSDVQNTAVAMAGRLIARCEGCSLEAYADPASGAEPWTVGFGSTRIDGAPVRPGQRITLAQADAALAGEVAADALVLREHLTTPLPAHQTAALLSFAYNEGVGALCGSTLLKLVNAGDAAGAAAEFGKWIYADAQVMGGLVRRRALERAVFCGQVSV